MPTASGRGVVQWPEVDLGRLHGVYLMVEWAACEAKSEQEGLALCRWTYNGISGGHRDSKDKRQNADVFFRF